jgi:uncharacterized damage-inducible protein DinB
MKAILAATLLVACAAPVAGAQAGDPVASAFRDMTARLGKNLVAAAEEMPADKYGYKPTPPQMTFGDVVAHLVEGNDYLCGAIGGAKAPDRGKLGGADSKEKLVASLRASFEFCDQAAARLADRQLGDSVPFFGGRKVTRAAAVLITVGDWEDHYSQMAIYLRLNGHLPPTARRRAS